MDQPLLSLQVTCAEWTFSIFVLCDFRVLQVSLWRRVGLGFDILAVCWDADVSFLKSRPLSIFSLFFVGPFLNYREWYPMSVVLWESFEVTTMIKNQ